MSNFGINIRAVKYFLIIVVAMVLSISCSKKYYLTAAGGERPLAARGDVFKIPCTGNEKPIIDTNFYYRRESNAGLVIERPLYRYVRFLDGCRLMLNKTSSEDPAHYAALEDPEGELIGKYSIDARTGQVVIKTFTALRWGIVIDNYGTVSKNGDTISIQKQDIPGIKNSYTYYLIKTNIPVRNRIKGTW